MYSGKIAVPPGGGGIVDNNNNNNNNNRDSEVTLSHWSRSIELVIMPLIDL
jgi:hypothetical protein